MPNNVLSGVQMIVSSLDNTKLPNKAIDPSLFPISFHEGEHEHCCACGGLLTKMRTSAREKISDSWRTSQELEAKDEDGLCAACEWFLSGINRTFFMPPHAFVMFDGHRMTTMDAQELYDFLKQGFNEPRILCICGNSLRLRKNVAWKLNRSISYSSHDVKVAFLDIKTGNGLYDGTATFDAEDMLNCIDSLLPLTKQYRVLANGFIKKVGGQYYYVLSHLMDYFRYQRGTWSEETFFAIYMACNLVFPKEEREKKPVAIEEGAAS